MTEPRERELTGELWSFLRSTLSQGKDIHLDHLNKGYEEYSARLDEAARERADALLKLLADFPATPEPRDG